METKNLIQGTEEWLETRIGKVTASRVADVMAKTKSGYSTSRANYMAEKVAEILTGQAPEHFTNSAMQHGTETEPVARNHYEHITGRIVSEVGLICHPTIERLAGSPDGVMSDRGLEIKCPYTATHIETLLKGTVKKQYVIQMQVNMMCTGLKKWDFMSFDNRLPDNLSTYIKTFEYDDELAKEIESEVVKFNAELEELLKKLQEIT